VVETLAFVYREEASSKIAAPTSNHRLKHHGRSVHQHQPENFHPLLVSNAKCIDLNSRNHKGQTAMHIAINKGYIKVICMLLKLGAQPNVQDSEGDTPLHDAITKRYDGIVELLLDANASIAVVNKLGFNVLHHAVLMDNARLVLFIFLCWPFLTSCVIISTHFTTFHNTL
jgi:ankyrin repeat protein